MSYESSENGETLGIEVIRHKNELWDLFIEYHWLRHKQQFEGAEERVHSFRRKFGYGYMLKQATRCCPITPSDLECVQGGYTEDEQEDETPLSLNKQKSQQQSRPKPRKKPHKNNHADIPSSELIVILHLTMDHIASTE